MSASGLDLVLRDARRTEADGAGRDGMDFGFSVGGGGGGGMFDGGGGGGGIDA